MSIYFFASSYLASFIDIIALKKFSSYISPSSTNFILELYSFNLSHSPKFKAAFDNINEIFIFNSSSTSSLLLFSLSNFSNSSSN